MYRTFYSTSITLIFRNIDKLKKKIQFKICFHYLNRTFVKFEPIDKWCFIKQFKIFNSNFYFNDLVINNNLNFKSTQI